MSPPIFVGNVAVKRPWAINRPCSSGTRWCSPPSPETVVNRRMSSSVNVRCHDNVSPTFKIRVPIRVNPWLQSPDPAVDLVHCVIEDLIRWLTEFFRRLERVVAAFNRIDLWRRAKILDVWFDFVRTAKRVASALHKEHRL